MLDAFCQPDVVAPDKVAFPEQRLRDNVGIVIAREISGRIHIGIRQLEALSKHRRSLVAAFHVLRDANGGTLHELARYGKAGSS